MSVFRHGRQLVVISHIRTLYTFVVGVVVVVTSELSGKMILTLYREHSLTLRVELSLYS